MKYPIFYSLFCVFCLLGFLALFQSKVKSDQKVTSVVEQIPEFNRIVMKGPATLYIQQTGEESVKIIGKKEAVEDVKVQVKYGELDIDRKHKRGWITSFFFKQHAPNIYVTLKDLEEVTLLGSGEVYSEDVIQSDNLNLAIEGSGNMHFDAKGKSLKVTINGSGTVYVSGVIDEQQVEIRGSGDYEGEGLQSKKAKISIYGSGDAVVNVTDLLNISISGSGNVSYHGKPKINKRITGAGNVIPLKG